MMKNILVITMDVNHTAPGVVYGKVLNSLKDYFTIHLVCPEVANGLDPCIDVISVPKYHRLKHKLETLCYRYFGQNFTDFSWAKKCCRTLKNENPSCNYDAVLSFVSHGNFAPLYLGSCLSRAWNIKWIVYSVDAIPTPLSWNPDKRIHRSLSTKINNLLKPADAFYSSNTVMLRYELDLFPRFNGIGGVVLTPFDNSVYNNKECHKDAFTFLYTGNIYGARKADTLLTAFKRYHKLNPNSKLVFVGKWYGKISDEYAPLIDDNSIIMAGFTDNLDPYYDSASVLLDIGADLPDDVFLSSKICNYLPINKPIIAITGDNSPARLLMSGVNSILHCHHDVDEIYDAMCKVQNLTSDSLSDRQVLLTKFSVSEVAKEFASSINQLIK